MAIFGKKQKKDLSAQAEVETPKKTDTVLGVKVSAKETLKKKTVKGSTKSNFGHNLSTILIRPRITEKATFKAEENVYVFEVMKDATKADIVLAMEHFYKVTPIKVNIAKIPPKIRMSRRTRKKGVKSGGKKAYVYLKKGTRIEIV